MPPVQTPLNSLRSVSSRIDSGGKFLEEALEEGAMTMDARVHPNRFA